MPANSFMHSENTVNFGNVFAMFETIREHTKCQRFGLRYGFVASRAVREDARQICHFADPAAVSLSLDFDGEVTHAQIVQCLLRVEKFVCPTSCRSADRRPHAPAYLTPANYRAPGH